MARTDSQVNVRLANELLDQLRSAASTSGRSLTAEVSLLLSKGLGIAPADQADTPPSAPEERLEGKTRMFGARITEPAIAKIGLLSRATGRGMSATLDRLILSYQPTAPEAKAIKALEAFDKAQEALKADP